MRLRFFAKNRTCVYNKYLRWYNEPIDHDSDVAEREDPLNCLGRGCACCGEKQRMLYSTEKSVNSTTEFVKMVVESQ